MPGYGNLHDAIKEFMQTKLGIDTSAATSLAHVAIANAILLTQALYIVNKKKTVSDGNIGSHNEGSESLPDKSQILKLLNPFDNSYSGKFFKAIAWAGIASALIGPTAMGVAFFGTVAEQTSFAKAVIDLAGAGGHSSINIGSTVGVLNLIAGHIPHLTTLATALATSKISEMGSHR